MTKRLSTVIVDCDPGSRDTLRELCKSRAELDLIAECARPDEAREVILVRRPDLAFVAAQLPAMSGLQLVRELPESVAPLTVFVSPHDQYAAQAFELGAVDYILEPVDKARFCATMQRVVSRARACEPRGRYERGVATRSMVGVDTSHGTAKEQRCPRIILEIGDRIHFVDVGDIESIEAERNYVWINTQDSYKVRASLKQIESLLPSDRFLRVNRSVILNSNRIASIERHAHGEYAIHLTGGGVFTTGRRFRGQIPGVVLRRQV